MAPITQIQGSTSQGELHEDVGPYTLVRRLGVGGMAETFLAVRGGPAGFSHGVCLKRLLPQHIPNPGYVELFLDEARLMAEMRCAQIVQVHELGMANGTYYVIMDLVEGADLEQLGRWLAKQGERLSAQGALWAIHQLLRALDYAHGLARGNEALRIVHRDVSPSNVLVGRTGDVKLTDFGIAKSVSRRHRTLAGHTKGKLAYMSPEQVLGYEVDAQSDVFAVGIMLFELLTGEHPFASKTELQLLNNIVRGSRKSFIQLVNDAEPGHTALVEDLLQLNPRRRPTARQALDRLQGLNLSPGGQDELADTVSRYRQSLELAGADQGIVGSRPHGGLCGKPTAISVLPFDVADEPSA